MGLGINQASSVGSESHLCTWARVFVAVRFFLRLWWTWTPPILLGVYDFSASLLKSVIITRLRTAAPLSPITHHTVNWRSLHQINQGLNSNLGNNQYHCVLSREFRCSLALVLHLCFSSWFRLSLNRCSTQSNHPSHSQLEWPIHHSPPCGFNVQNPYQYPYFCYRAKIHFRPYSIWFKWHCW